MNKIKIGKIRTIQSREKVLVKVFEPKAQKAWVIFLRLIL